MAAPLTKAIGDDLYGRDFFEWTREQARLLREGRFADLDFENLTDEMEAVGSSEKSEIESRLDVLVAHLLGWKFQPGARSSGWLGTIGEQRRRIARRLRASPSLQAYPAEAFADAYLSGRRLAAKETGLDFALLPEQPPFTVEQALDESYLPREPGLLDPFRSEGPR